VSDHPYEPRDQAPVLAHRSGFCDACKTRIHPGEEIVKVDGKWVHAEGCVEEVEAA
jgi:hypothetical protein